jgi:hypothetical protein
VYCGVGLIFISMVSDKAAVISSGRCVIWSWSFVIFPILSLVFEFCGVVYLRIDWDLVCLFIELFLVWLLAGGLDCLGLCVFGMSQCMLSVLCG